MILKTGSIVIFSERVNSITSTGKTSLIGVVINPANRNVKTILRESRSFEKLPARFIKLF